MDAGDLHFRVLGAGHGQVESRGKINCPRRYGTHQNFLFLPRPAGDCPTRLREYMIRAGHGDIELCGIVIPESHIHIDTPISAYTTPVKPDTKGCVDEIEAACRRELDIVGIIFIVPVLKRSGNLRGGAIIGRQCDCAALAPVIRKPVGDAIHCPIRRFKIWIQDEILAEQDITARSLFQCEAHRIEIAPRPSQCIDPRFVIHGFQRCIVVKRDVKRRGCKIDVCNKIAQILCLCIAELLKSEHGHIVSSSQIDSDRAVSVRAANFLAFLWVAADATVRTGQDKHFSRCCEGGVHGRLAVNFISDGLQEGGPKVCIARDGLNNTFHDAVEVTEPRLALVGVAQI